MGLWGSAYFQRVRNACVNGHDALSAPLTEPEVRAKFNAAFSGI